jgi:choline-glycine betaine transporter
VQFILGSKAIAFSLLMAYLCFARGQYVSANALSAILETRLRSIIGRIFDLLSRLRTCVLIARTCRFIHPAPRKTISISATAGARMERSERGFTAASVAAISLYAKSCCAARLISKRQMLFSAHAALHYLFVGSAAHHLIGLEGMTESLLTLLRLLLCILVCARVQCSWLRRCAC